MLTNTTNQHQLRVGFFALFLPISGLGLILCLSPSTEAVMNQITHWPQAGPFGLAGDVINLWLSGTTSQWLLNSCLLGVAIELCGYHHLPVKWVAGTFFGGGILLNQLIADLWHLTTQPPIAIIGSSGALFALYGLLTAYFAPIMCKYLRQTKRRRETPAKALSIDQTKSVLHFFIVICLSTLAYGNGQLTDNPLSDVVHLTGWILGLIIGICYLYTKKRSNA